MREPGLDLDDLRALIAAARRDGHPAALKGAAKIEGRLGAISQPPPSVSQASPSPIGGAPLVRGTVAEIGRLLDEVISIGAAADLAGVTEKTIRQWARRYPGIGVKRGGRWAISKQNISIMLKAGTPRYLELIAQQRQRRPR